MKFSLEPSTLHKALRAMQRRHPSNPRRDARLRITATADGVALETNLTGAFLPAQVAVPGACEVSRESVTRVVGTFPRGKPATVEARNGRLRIDGWGIETSAQFDPLENERPSDDNQGGSMLSERFTQAVDYAREAHASQTRKGTSIPYIAHLLGVASLVLDYGGDEDQAIAALLHDAIEDQGTHHEALIRRQFGDRVASLVLACTDGTQEDKAKAATPEAKRADWKRRKQRYLAHLVDVPCDALLVSGCDKLHNARAIVADLRNPAIGLAVFDRFTGGRDGTLWYYREISRVFTQRSASMASALSDTVATMAS